MTGYTPVVWKTAALLGVDLSKVTGTGVGGRTTTADVARAAAFSSGRVPPAIGPAVPATADVTPTAAALGEMPRNELSDRRTATWKAALAADELGVDIDQVSGTGPGGQITAEDVRNAAFGIRPQDPSHIPAFTVSGWPPEQLRALPAPIRAAVAAAPTQDEARRLASKYRGMTDEAAAAALAVDWRVPAQYGGCKSVWPT